MHDRDINHFDFLNFSPRNPLMVEWVITVYGWNTIRNELNNFIDIRLQGEIFLSSNVSCNFYEKCRNINSMKLHIFYNEGERNVACSFSWLERGTEKRPVK